MATRSITLSGCFANLYGDGANMTFTVYSTVKMMTATTSIVQNASCATGSSMYVSRM